MTREQAKDFAFKAISLAVELDGSSGGSIRMVDITKDGVERSYIPNGDLWRKD